MRAKISNFHIDMYICWSPDLGSTPFQPSKLPLLGNFLEEKCGWPSYFSGGGLGGKLHSSCAWTNQSAPSIPFEGAIPKSGVGALRARQKCWIPRCGGGASFCYPKSGTLFNGVSAQVNQSVIQFCSIQKSILLSLFIWNMEHVLGCFTCLIWSLLHGAVMGIKGGINTCINLMVNQLFNLCNL